MKKISRAMALTTILSISLLLSLPALAKDNRPALKIVKDSLVEYDNFYSVKGTIYNPYDRPVKNVVITYHIWKKWMGSEGHGSVIKETGGLVLAKVKYIPPKQSVEFTASGGDTAPAMTTASGLLPDPLDAEIFAEWDK